MCLEGNHAFRTNYGIVGIIFAIVSLRFLLISLRLLTTVCRRFASLAD